MASTKTKAVVALGMLDIARQAAHAWSAKARAEQQRIGFGAGLRADARQLARDARDRVPSPSDLEWSMPPWRNEPTVGERLRTWAPLAMVAALASAAVVVAAHVIARREDELETDEFTTDARMIGAVRAGSKAIDAGVAKVVEGGSTAAVGAASTVAAGSAAVKSATVNRAKDEFDEHVVQPAKKKAITYSAVGLLALTIYVIVIAAVVQLIVAAIS